MTVKDIKKRIEDIETNDGDVKLLTLEEADFAVENNLLSKVEMYWYTDEDKYCAVIERDLVVRIEAPISQISSIRDEVYEFIKTIIINSYDVSSFSVVEE